jgi:hypothetical protein
VIPLGDDGSTVEAEALDVDFAVPIALDLAGVFPCPSVSIPARDFKVVLGPFVAILLAGVLPSTLAAFPVGWVASHDEDVVARWAELPQRLGSFETGRILLPLARLAVAGQVAPDLGVLVALSAVGRRVSPSWDVRSQRQPGAQAITGSATAMFVPPVEGIRVPATAGCGVRARLDRPTGVLGAGDGLQVIRSTTSSIPAEMVECRALGQGPYSQPPEFPMHVLGSSVDREDAIASNQRATPEPASVIRCLQSRLDALQQRHPTREGCRGGSSPPGEVFGSSHQLKVLGTRRVQAIPENRVFL